MSTLVHTIDTPVSAGPVVRTSVIEIYGGQYVVQCNGDEVGHECSGREDVRIEDGDTWSADNAVVEFAEMHAAEHRERSDGEHDHGAVVREQESGPYAGEVTS